MSITAQKMLNSPLRWAGGKSRLRKTIIPLLEPHLCYVEPFGGGGSVLFGKESSDVEVYNDIDSELVNFFRVVRDHPQELLDSFEWELVVRARFDELARANPEGMTPVARAHRLFYLLLAGWGGESKYPRFQISINDNGSGNRLIGALKTLEAHIMPISERLRGVILENQDWEVILERYDGPNTVFYIDPPYPGNGVNYQHNMRGWEDHLRLAERLNTLKGRWILSNYDKPEVRGLYGEDRHIIPVRWASGMATSGGASRVTNQEILVCNFTPSKQGMAGIEM